MRGLQLGKVKEKHPSHTIVYVQKRKHTLPLPPFPPPIPQPLNTFKDRYPLGPLLPLGDPHTEDHTTPSHHHHLLSAYTPEQKSQSNPPGRFWPFRSRTQKTHTTSSPPILLLPSSQSPGLLWPAQTPPFSVFCTLRRNDTAPPRAAFVAGAPHFHFQLGMLGLLVASSRAVLHHLRLHTLNVRGRGGGGGGGGGGGRSVAVVVACAAGGRLVSLCVSECGMCVSVFVRAWLVSSCVSRSRARARERERESVCVGGWVGVSRRPALHHLRLHTLNVVSGGGGGGGGGGRNVAGRATGGRLVSL